MFIELRAYYLVCAILPLLLLLVAGIIAGQLIRSRKRQITDIPVLFLMVLIPAWVGFTLVFAPQNRLNVLLATNGHFNSLTYKFVALGDVPLLSKGLQIVGLATDTPSGYTPDLATTDFSEGLRVYNSYDFDLIEERVLLSKVQMGERERVTIPAQTLQTREFMPLNGYLECDPRVLSHLTSGDASGQTWVACIEGPGSKEMPIPSGN